MSARPTLDEYDLVFTWKGENENYIAHYVIFLAWMDLNSDK